MREVISLHVGQCGKRLGHTCWEQFESEMKAFQITENEEQSSPEAFFKWAEKSKSWTPRALYFDSRSHPPLADVHASLEAVQQPPCIRPAIGADGSLSQEMKDSISEGIRKESEASTNLQGFFLYFSMNGFTSRVLSEYIQETIKGEYTNKTINLVCVLPPITESLDYRDTYNIIKSWGTQTGVRFLFDNGTIRNNSIKSNFKARPNLNDINLQISEALSYLTTKIRLQKGSHFQDTSEFQSSLVPYPEVCNIASDIGALRPLWSAKNPTTPIEAIAGMPYSIMAGIPSDHENNKYIATFFNFRGKSLAPQHLGQALKDQAKRQFEYVGWDPCYPKFSFVQESFPQPYRASLKESEVSCAVITNSGIFRSNFNSLLQAFDRQAPRHQHLEGYSQEGIEESLFNFRNHQVDLREVYN